MIGKHFMHHCMRRFVDHRLLLELEELRRIRDGVDRTITSVDRYRNEVKQFGLDTSYELEEIAMTLATTDCHTALAKVSALRERVQRDTQRFSMLERDRGAS